MVQLPSAAASLALPWTEMSVCCAAARTGPGRCPDVFTAPSGGRRRLSSNLYSAAKTRGNKDANNHFMEPARLPRGGRARLRPQTAASLKPGLRAKARRCVNPPR